MLEILNDINKSVAHDVGASGYSNIYRGDTSMSIYPHDPISEALGLRNIYEVCPDFDSSVKLPVYSKPNCKGMMNAFWGMEHTEETKAKLKKAWDNEERKTALAEMAKDPEVCKKRKKSVQSWYDKASKEEVKAKTKNGLSNMNSHVQCPHCGIKTNKGNIGRYHGDKCKQKNS